MKKNNIPIISLSNGLRVGNFSSPHSFLFEDGCVLPACSEDRSRALNIDMLETPVKTLNIQNTDVKFITIDARISPNVIDEIEQILMVEKVDIVIVPRSVLEALHYWELSNTYITFCTGRLKDRIHKILYIDKFCTI